MTPVNNDLTDLEAKAATGTFTRADAERLLASPDLISIGMLGEAARQALTGNEVTFGRVCEIGEFTDGGAPPSIGEAGEVRLIGRPGSIEQACDVARRGRGVAGSLPLTGFSSSDLLDLCGSDHLALASAASQLKSAGLEAVAECPIDRFAGVDDAVEVIEALRRGGLGVWRLTVDRADRDVRVDQAERAAAVQRAVGGLHAFAPLPRLDPLDTPSTGYDDVRTVAIARLLCRVIERIQVDWPLYGPKLAQVALAYGANDVDGVAAVDTLSLGVRRSPREDIMRQIRTASCEPVERNGRFERRP